MKGYEYFRKALYILCFATKYSTLVSKMLGFRLLYIYIYIYKYNLLSLLCIDRIVNMNNISVMWPIVNICFCGQVASVECFINSVDSQMRQREEKQKLAAIAGRIEAYEAGEGASEEVERVRRINYESCKLRECFMVYMRSWRNK